MDRVRFHATPAIKCIRVCNVVPFVFLLWMFHKWIAILSVVSDILTLCNWNGAVRSLTIIVGGIVWAEWGVGLFTLS